MNLGIGNECYHIKYENILRNFVDFLQSAFFDPKEINRGIKVVKMKKRYHI